MYLRYSLNRNPLEKKIDPSKKSILDLIACPLIVWSPDRSSCILNQRAKQLTDWSDGQLREIPSLWMDRIHPQDQRLYSTAWEKLQKGEKIVSCDYRFFPNRSDKEIWLRDVSVSHQNPFGEIESIECVVSSYTNISDLKARRPGSEKELREGEGVKVAVILGNAIHEIQNNLQTMSLGHDLLRQYRASVPDYPGDVSYIERINKVLQEVHGYLTLPESQYSLENPEIILEDVARHMQKELQHQGILMRVVRRGPLPAVRLDLAQFRSALERVMEFSRALLAQGGELEIQTGLQEIHGQRYVELKVASFSATSLGVEENDVFQPFLRVNGHQVGLSIALAHRILRRHHGKVFFQKENRQRGRFTILLKVI